jgi:hypothetical protein
MTRKSTKLLLEMLEEGLLDGPDVLRACLNYMSEDDVTDMAESNGFFEGLNLDEEDEEDDE